MSCKRLPSWVLSETPLFWKRPNQRSIEQGYEIGRPSLLLLKAEDKEGKIDVYVGGNVVMVAKGEFI